MCNERKQPPDAGKAVSPSEVPSGPPAHGTEQLRSYTRIKQALARQVRALKRLLEDLREGGLANECGELMVKLAEDRFTLAVVGQFKRGKSSLMNAIIGRDLLPTGVLPLTSAVTILKYGPRERLIIHADGQLLPEHVPLSSLSYYVTEVGNPGNRRRIRDATLELPLPFLRHGLEFVDTPGTGSSIEANTATTYDFLPQCDAVIFVTSVDGPLTKGELEFLEQVRSFVRKMFFVVNKIDLLAESERDSVLSFIRETLGNRMGADSARIFPLSSRVAMAAKMSGDTTGREESGLPRLENALAAFLSSDKTATFLTSIADKAVQLLDKASAARLEEWKGAHDKIRTRLLALRASLLGEVSGASRPSERKAGSPALPRELVAPAPATKTLEVSLTTRGCPACSHMAEQLFALLSQWQNALASHEEVQEAFAAAGGFCPLHTWQMVSVASPQGLSLGYTRLAETVAASLSQAADQDAGGIAPSARPGHEGCRICRVIRESEREYLDALRSFIHSAEGRSAYLRSYGLCLRHLDLLTGGISDPALCQALVRHAANRFEEAAEDMQNFAMKRDALRRHLKNKDDDDAYLRAVIHIVGERAVSTPWPKDVEL